MAYYINRILWYVICYDALILFPSLSRSPSWGGGWQDQVGGLVGGVKVARSKACLPLRVEVERLPLSDDFLLSLQQHLLLVYTGKTRLARNLLQVNHPAYHLFKVTMLTP